MNNELLVARIVSGVVRLKIKGRSVVLRRPTPEQLYEAEEVFEDTFNSALEDGLLSPFELLEFLLERGFWDEEKNKLIEQVPLDIQDSQVKLFENIFRSDIQGAIRKILESQRAKFAQLWAERHAFDHLGAEGLAKITRAKFLLYCELNGPHADYHSFAASDSSLDTLYQLYSNSRLSESVLRSLARTEPWRSIWNCKKAEGGRIFDRSPTCYTDEQRSLVNWSLLYDNVYEHPECPSDEVIADDDVLDGWLIIQKRKRAGGSSQNADSLIKNEKIRNSDEVFIIADSQKDADRIHKMNSGEANRVRRSRLNAVKKHGSVDETKLPDVKQKIRQQATQMHAQAMGVK